MNLKRTKSSYESIPYFNSYSQIPDSDDESIHDSLRKKVKRQSICVADPILSYQNSIDFNLHENPDQSLGLYARGLQSLKESSFKTLSRIEPECKQLLLDDKRSDDGQNGGDCCFSSKLSSSIGGNSNKNIMKNVFEDPLHSIHALKLQKKHKSQLEVKNRKYSENVDHSNFDTFNTGFFNDLHNLDLNKELNLNKEGLAEDSKLSQLINTATIKVEAFKANLRLVQFNRKEREETIFQVQNVDVTKLFQHKSTEISGFYIKSHKLSIQLKEHTSNQQFESKASPEELNLQNAQNGHILRAGSSGLLSEETVTPFKRLKAEVKFIREGQAIWKDCFLELQILEDPKKKQITV